MDFETLPIGTEELLKSLGWHLTPSRLSWTRRSRSSDLPAGSPEPDRLGAAAAAQMSEIEPEKKLPFGLPPEHFEGRN